MMQKQSLKQSKFVFLIQNEEVYIFYYSSIFQSSHIDYFYYYAPQNTKNETSKKRFHRQSNQFLQVNVLASKTILGLLVHNKNKVNCECLRCLDKNEKENQNYDDNQLLSVRKSNIIQYKTKKKNKEFQMVFVSMALHLQFILFERFKMKQKKTRLIYLLLFSMDQMGQKKINHQMKIIQLNDKACSFNEQEAKTKVNKLNQMNHRNKNDIKNFLPPDPQMVVIQLYQIPLKIYFIPKKNSFQNNQYFEV